MKNLILIMLVLWGNFAFAQEKKQSTIDFKLGIGYAQFGTGDYGMTRFEAEITKKWNKWLSTSAAINTGIGYNNPPFFYQVNALHGDLNVFISPFGNQRRNNFKLGTGFTAVYANVTAQTGKRNVYNEETRTITEVEYFNTETRRTTGFSMILENELSVTERFLLGAKVLVQPYSNGDILAGFTFNIGMKF